jgi:hypothetical protein
VRRSKTLDDWLGGDVAVAGWPTDRPAGGFSVLERARRPLPAWAGRLDTACTAELYSIFVGTLISLILFFLSHYMCMLSLFPCGRNYILKVDVRTTQHCTWKRSV